MADNNFDEIDDLIGKFLAGEATPGEKAELDRWLQESEANRKYYAQLETIFVNAGSSSVQQQFDTDAAWQKVRQKLKGSDQAGVRDRFEISGASYQMSRSQFEEPPSGFAWRIAAGVLLILAVSYAANRWFNPNIQTDVIASKAATVSDTLPDGSTAFLNKRSELHYEYNPRWKTRKVKLSGEAYFVVKHEAEKPFVIEAEEVQIKDLGTTFNVRAYPESETVEVVVEEGEVQIYTSDNPGLHINAGEKGIYDKNLKEFSKIMKLDTNTLAYKTGVFNFNKSDLRTVVDLINEVYGSKVKLTREALGDCHVTVSFNNESIETVIEILSETLNLKVTRQDDEILLDGNGCK